MEYLLTQEELDSRDTSSKSECTKKKEELVLYFHQAYKWMAQNSSQFQFKKPFEVLEEMQKSIGPLPKE